MDNENIKKAEEKLEYLNGDAEARAIAEYLADAKRNEISALAAARLEGETQGKLEGKLENRTEIIKKMLAENIDIKIIAKVTDTSIQEILDIKNSK